MVVVYGELCTSLYFSNILRAGKKVGCNVVYGFMVSKDDPSLYPLSRSMIYSLHCKQLLFANSDKIY
jgi:hypothetical protein